MSFDISRLRRADQIVGGGAIALFIFLFFFKWYGVSSNVTSIAGVNVGGSVSKSGWDTFTNSRWIWLITIIVALGAVLLVAGQRKLESPIQPSVIVAALGALSAVLILYRIIHHPTASASFGTFHASAGIKIGIWFGLIAAAAITYGGYLQMQAEGTSLSDVREQASEAFSGITASTGGAASAGSTGESAPTATQPTPPPTRATPPATPPVPSPAPPPIPPPATPPSPGPGGETPPAASNA